MTGQPTGRQIPFYLLTPAVYAWLWSRLWQLEVAAAKAPFGDVGRKLREQAKEAAEKIERIVDALASLGGFPDAAEFSKAFAEQRAGRGMAKLPDPPRREWWWDEGSTRSPAANDDEHHEHEGSTPATQPPRYMPSAGKRVKRQAGKSVAAKKAKPKAAAESGGMW